MGRSISVRSAHYSHAALSKYIAALKNEFVYGGHLTALGAPVKVLTVSILLNVPVSIPLLFIAYLAPLIVYSVDHYQSLEKDMATNLERTMYLTEKVGILPYLIAFYVALLVISLALFANLGLILLTAMLGLYGIMYSTVFKGLTKQIPGFKNIFTSGIWAIGVTFGLPLYYSLPLSPFYVFAFLFIFLRSLGNVVFFDLKDVGSDAAEGLKTVPVLLGKRAYRYPVKSHEPCILYTAHRGSILPRNADCIRFR